MKKVFTLVTGLLLAVVMFAASPSVTINTSGNYEVSIDGKKYSTTNNGNTIRITDIRNGSHSIKVYEVNNRFFGKTRKLVSQSTFTVQDNDVRINIDRNGAINVRESRVGRNSNDRTSRNEDNRSNGRGNKYGHNKEWKKDKNKKWKNGKNKKDRDWDDDDDNRSGKNEDDSWWKRNKN